MDTEGRPAVVCRSIVDKPCPHLLVITGTYEQTSYSALSKGLDVILGNVVVQICGRDTHSVTCKSKDGAGVDSLAEKLGVVGVIGLVGNTVNSLISGGNADTGYNVRTSLNAEQILNDLYGCVDLGGCASYREVARGQYVSVRINVLLRAAIIICTPEGMGIGMADNLGIVVFKYVSPEIYDVLLDRVGVFTIAHNVDVLAARRVILSVESNKLVSEDSIGELQFIVLIHHLGCEGCGILNSVIDDEGNRTRCAVFADNLSADTRKRAGKTYSHVIRGGGKPVTAGNHYGCHTAVLCARLNDDHSSHRGGRSYGKCGISLIDIDRNGIIKGIGCE